MKEKLKAKKSIVKIQNVNKLRLVREHNVKESSSQSGVKHSAKQVSEMTLLRNDTMSLRFVICE